MSKIVNNERRKLLANMLNSLGVAFAATGVIAPFLGNKSLFSWTTTLAVIGAFILHGIGQWILGGLVE